MDAFFDRIAPKSWEDFVVKWLAIYGALMVFNYLVQTGLYGPESYNFVQEMILITVVGGPFIYLALYIFGRQFRLRQQLASLAATDMLTGLSNRGDFIRRTRDMLYRGKSGAILLADADHFKRVNDNFGHDAGDLCLQAVAQKLALLVREDDIVGRFGGEEFAIFLPHATPEMARAVGQRISEGVKVELPDYELDLHLTLSVGIARLRASDTLEKSISLADEALYRAKELGRARFEFAEIASKIA